MVDKYFGASFSALNRAKENMQKTQNEIFTIKNKIIEYFLSEESNVNDLQIIIAELIDSVIQVENSLNEALIVSENLRIENKLAYKVICGSKSKENCIKKNIQKTIRPFSKIPTVNNHKRNVVFIFQTFFTDENNKKTQISPKIIEIIIFCFNAFLRENVSLYYDENKEHIIGIILEETTLFSIHSSLINVNKEIKNVSKELNFSLCYINNNPISILIESLIENHKNVSLNDLKNGFINPYNFELDCIEQSYKNNSMNVKLELKDEVDMPMT